MVLCVFFQAFQKEWILKDYQGCAADFAQTCISQPDQSMTACDRQCELKCAMEHSNHQAPLSLTQLRLPEIVMYYEAQESFDFLKPYTFKTKPSDFIQITKTKKVSSTLLKPPTTLV